MAPEFNGDRRALPSSAGSGDGGGDRVSGADDLVDRAGRALGWLARSGWSVARRLPGGELAERQLQRVEQALVGEVHRRLDQVDGKPPPAWEQPLPDEPAAGRATRVEPRPDSLREPLRAAMAELLDRSVTDSRERAREYFFATILRQLVPDEARIVAALADGTVYPLVHVATRTALGGVQRTVLENASTVGRASGVSLPGLVPVYVTRLLRSGLAEVGDEDPALGVQYEMLLTDDRVREADERIRAHGRHGPRYVRLTLRISDLGRQFWQACDPSARVLPPGARG